MRRNVLLALTVLLSVTSAWAGVGVLSLSGGAVDTGPHGYVGYDAVGASSAGQPSGSIRCSAKFTPATNMTIQSIQVYSTNSSSFLDLRIGMYSGSPTTQVGSEYLFSDIGSYSTPEWKTFNVNYSLSSGIQYWFCTEVSVGGYFIMYYDAGTGTLRASDNNTWGTEWPDAFTSDSTSSSVFSIRGQY